MAEFVNMVKLKMKAHWLESKGTESIAELLTTFKLVYDTNKIHDGGSVSVLLQIVREVLAILVTVAYT